VGGKDFPWLLLSLILMPSLSKYLQLKQKVSGDDCGFGQLTEMERKWGKILSGVATG
jgi:hypothetical protein